MKSSKVEFTRIERDFGNHRVVTPDPELAESIRAVGLLQPPVVWHRRTSGTNPHILPDGKPVYDRYFLLAGHRRMAALDLIRAGYTYTEPNGTLSARPADPEAFDRIVTSLFEGSEDDALYAQATENMQREDLKPSEAAGVVEGFRRRGHEDVHIAAKLGRSVSWVQRILAYADYVPPVLKAATEGGMGVDTALDLAKASPEAQRAAAEAFAQAVSQTSSVRKGNKAARAKAASVDGLRRAPSAKEVARRLRYLESLPKPSADVKLACQVLAWVRGAGEYPSQLPGV